MAYKRKYTKGGIIKSLDEMAQQEFVYIHDKIYHAGWFMSLQFHFVKKMVEAGCVCRAEPRTEDGKKE